VNGQSVDGYNTAAACQAYCAGVAACVAVDFNTGDRSCWVHLNAADLEDNNVYDEDGTDQYRIDRTCVTTETPTTTSTGQAGINLCRYRPVRRTAS